MGTIIGGNPDPFLDTANWQGVDDEPTAGSDNLVKSGGIYDNIESTSVRHKQKLHIIEGKFWIKSGDKVVIGSHVQTNRVDRINVIPGSIWNIKCIGLASAESYYIADKEMNYITSSGSASLFEDSITIPDNGYYLLLNTTNTADSVIPNAIEKDSVLQQLGVIDTFKTGEKVGDTEIIDKPSFESQGLTRSKGVRDYLESNTVRHNQELDIFIGKFWNKSGNKIIISSHPELRRVERIVVNPGSVWNITCRGMAAAESYYIADESMNYITSSGSADTFNGEITIPNNGYYLLMNTDGSITIKAIENGSILQQVSNLNSELTNKITENRRDIIDLFDNHYYNIDQTLYNIVYGFIKDIEFSTINTNYLQNVYLLHILNGAVIASTTYYSIIVRFKTDLGEHSDIIFNIGPNRTGIQYYDITQSGFTMKAVVDWNALSGVQYNYNGYLEGEAFRFKDEYCRKHIGDIYYLQPNETDQLFIYNKEVVCFNNYRSDIDYYAKYAKVDIGSNCKKIMCKFKIIGKTSSNILCLATLSGNSIHPIADITASSFHVVISRESLKFGVFTNEVWDVTTVNLSSFLTENTEYEFGYEFLGNNSVKFYLPDGTTDTRTISGADDANGKYVVYELYGPNYDSNITINFPRVTITSIYAKPVNGIELHDNFNRVNGALTVAPSGHVYRLFRNYSAGDTKYDYEG